MNQAQDFASFREFYPYYLQEHSNPTCRYLHYAGTTFSVALFFSLVMSLQFQWLWILLFTGYAPAWIGHFFFEKNRPATFRHPLYSLRGDFVMWWEWLGFLLRKLAS